MVAVFIADDDDKKVWVGLGSGDGSCLAKRIPRDLGMAVHPAASFGLVKVPAYPFLKEPEFQPDPRLPKKRLDR